MQRTPSQVSAVALLRPKLPIHLLIFFRCDKRIPNCLRCEKLQKPCPGYDKKRKFVDEGVGLRKKFQGPSDGESRLPEAGGQLGSFQAHPLTDSPTFSGGPSTHHTPNENRNEEVPPTSDPSTAAQPQGHWQASLPQAGAPVNMGGIVAPQFPPMQFTDNDPTFDQWFDSSFDPELFDIDPSAFYSRNNNSCGFIPNAPNIVDEVRSEALRDRRRNY